MATLIHAAAFVSAHGEVLDGRVLLDEHGIVALGDEAVTLAASLKKSSELVEKSDASEELHEVYLLSQVLIPAFVNAHSHAFQRVLRGRVEHRSAEFPKDDFWSWRKKMYTAALSLSADAFEAVATWCYRDMVRAGFSVVGEFHYVHHDEGGSAYDVPLLSLGVARAAEKVGLQITLLNTAYERAGPGQKALPTQRRFVFANVKSFLEHCRLVRDVVTGTGIRHGLAIHSMRACSSSWRQALAEEADHHLLPLHVHACEQLAELQMSQQYYGKNPLQVLDDDGVLSERCALVHATHIDEDDIQLIARRGAQVVLCPSTERNLGDGLCPILDLYNAHVPLSIGSDSHARIDPVDELRSLEDHERLRLKRRNVLTQPGKSLRHALLFPGTFGGRRSLGLSTEAGKEGGDVVSIPLGVVVEAFGPGAAVDEFLVGGAGQGGVKNMWSRGIHVLQEGELRGCDELSIEKAALEVLKTLA